MVVAPGVYGIFEKLRRRASGIHGAGWLDMYQDLKSLASRPASIVAPTDSALIVIPWCIIVLSVIALVQSMAFVISPYRFGAVEIAFMFILIKIMLTLYGMRTANTIQLLGFRHFVGRFITGSLLLVLYFNAVGLSSVPRDFSILSGVWYAFALVIGIFLVCQEAGHSLLPAQVNGDWNNALAGSVVGKPHLYLLLADMTRVTLIIFMVSITVFPAPHGTAWWINLPFIVFKMLIVTKLGGIASAAYGHYFRKLFTPGVYFVAGMITLGLSLTACFV